MGVVQSRLHPLQALYVPYLNLFVGFILFLFACANNDVWVPKLFFFLIDWRIIDELTWFLGGWNGLSYVYPVA